MQLMECGSCGVQYAVTEKWYDGKVAAKASFCCPNGCTRKFTGENSEHTRVKEELERTKREKANIEQQLAKLQREKRKADRMFHKFKVPSNTTDK